MTAVAFFCNLVEVFGHKSSSFPRDMIFFLCLGGLRLSCPKHGLHLHLHLNESRERTMGRDMSRKAEGGRRKMPERIQRCKVLNICTHAQHEAVLLAGVDLFCSFVYVPREGNIT
ncbi:hypothetical protein VTL71DRAFT_1312 [Oculimacula yallundae]|uniref:Uncharacterized protein n=1 Tax=Oculimacula yallundae TaxID=86028 RepID=A0ABR4CAD2_9HELO